MQQVSDLAVLAPPPEISPYCRRSTASRYRRLRLLTKMAHTHADIPFKPPLENVDLLDGQACDQAIETCYRYEVEKLDQLGRPITSNSAR
jgi:hypothetical protein